MEKIILKDIPDLHKIDVYTSNNGYTALKKVLTQMKPDDVIEEVKVRSAWPRRSLFFDRTQMVIYAEGK